jgi:hypothetical protein
MKLGVQNKTAYNSKQYPMAAKCVKKIYYFYKTLLQCDFGCSKPPLGLLAKR